MKAIHHGSFPLNFKSNESLVIDLRQKNVGWWKWVPQKGPLEDDKNFNFYFTWNKKFFSKHRTCLLFKIIAKPEEYMAKRLFTTVFHDKILSETSRDKSYLSLLIELNSYHVHHPNVSFIRQPTSLFRKTIKIHSLATML